jgi:chromosomal replication initiator protein
MKIWLRDIERAICFRFNIDQETLKSRSRRSDHLRARQIGYYLSREMTMCSYPQIARYYGGRDHSTVIYGVRKIEGRLARSEAFRSEVLATTAVVLELRDRARKLEKIAPPRVEAGRRGSDVWASGAESSIDYIGY